MRQVEANLKANLAVEASVQAAAGMRTNTQSKILYTRQYLQVCGDAWRGQRCLRCRGARPICVRRLADWQSGSNTHGTVPYTVCTAMHTAITVGGGVQCA